MIKENTTRPMFVSYMFKSGLFTVGQAIVLCSPIRTHEDIGELRKRLEESTGLKEGEIVILGFRRLED